MDLFQALSEGNDKPSDFELYLARESLWLVRAILEGDDLDIARKKANAEAVIAKTLATYKSWISTEFPEIPVQAIHHV